MQTESSETSTYWTAGWLVMAGLLLGALTGWLLDEMPLGTVGGLALGVGVDSWIARRVNERPDE